MALSPKAVLELSQVTKTLLENWMRIKLVFQKAFGKGEIRKEEENAFLHLKGEIMRHFRVINDKIPKDLQFEGESMIDMLKNALSMEHLQGLPVAEKRNIFSLWHKIYVKLSRSLGALEVISDGYYPFMHRELIKPTRKSEARKPGKPAKKK